MKEQHVCTNGMQSCSFSECLAALQDQDDEGFDLYTPVDISSLTFVYGRFYVASAIKDHKYFRNLCTTH